MEISDLDREVKELIRDLVLGLQDDEHKAGFPANQKCKYGPELATHRVFHAEGMAYVPVCDAHLARAKSRITSGGRDPSEITRIEEVKYDVSPLGTGKNWVTSVGGLPLFIRAIAHALIRNGHSESRAISIAVGTVKRWARGGGNVTAKTRAKAALAVAEWERKKVQARAKSLRWDDEQLDSGTKDSDRGDQMQIEYKCVGVSGVKVIGDENDGLIEAIVSVTGLRDNVKDTIEPGAYAKTLATRVPKGVWGHTWNEPVSRTESIKELLPGDPGLPETLPNGQPWPEGAGGLKVLTRFNLETQRGREAHSDVKFFGDQQEWSIGYNVPVGGANIDPKTGARSIKELDLYEYSPVLFGAMPSARTTSVKDAQFAFKALSAGELDEVIIEAKSLVEEKARRRRPMMDEEGAVEDTAPAEEVDDGPDVEPDADPDDMPMGRRRRGYGRGAGNKALSAAQAQKVQDAIDALKALIDDGTEEGPSEGGQEEKGLSNKTLVDLVRRRLNDVDLVRAAAEFDAAAKSGNVAQMEAAAEPILDEVQDRIEGGEDDPEDYADIPELIATQLMDAEESQGEQSSDSTASSTGEAGNEGSSTSGATSGNDNTDTAGSKSFIDDYSFDYQIKRDFTTGRREDLGKQGHAFLNSSGKWSYPIENLDDLDNAYQAWGRAAEADREPLRAYLLKQAKRLNAGQEWMAKIEALGGGSGDGSKTITVSELKSLEALLG